MGSTHICGVHKFYNGPYDNTLSPQRFECFVYIEHSVWYLVLDQHRSGRFIMNKIWKVKANMMEALHASLSKRSTRGWQSND